MRMIECDLTALLRLRETTADKREGDAGRQAQSTPKENLQSASLCSSMVRQSHKQPSVGQSGMARVQSVALRVHAAEQSFQA